MINLEFSNGFLFLAAPSKLQDLPKSGNDLMFSLAPVAVREEDPDDGYCEHVLVQPATISQVDPDLLHSEIALLPGNMQNLVSGFSNIYIFFLAF